MKVNIPGQGELNLETIVLDLNGTLAVHRKVAEGAYERLVKLKEKGFKIILFSGDTRGNAQKTADELGIEFIQAGTDDEKVLEIGKLNPGTCVAIGNGFIDLKKIQKAKLGIVTLQAERVHIRTLLRF